MKCKCSDYEKFKGIDAFKYKDKFLSKIKIDANSWKGLYKCNECNQLWEESFDEGRFGGDIILKKIEKNHAKINWDIEI